MIRIRSVKFSTLFPLAALPLAILILLQTFINYRSVELKKELIAASNDVHVSIVRPILPFRWHKDGPLAIYQMESFDLWERGAIEFENDSYAPLALVSLQVKSTVTF